MADVIDLMGARVARGKPAIVPSVRRRRWRELRAMSWFAEKPKPPSTAVEALLGGDEQ